MSLDFREIPADTIAYNAAAPQTIDLPKDFAIFGLRLRLAGRLTIAGGANSGTPWTENPMSLIENLRVYGVKKQIGNRPGGAVEIIDIDAASLYELCSVLDEGADERTAVSAGAAADYDFVCSIDVPLHNKGNKMSTAAKAFSLLPAWMFSDLKLQLKFRDGTLTTTGGLISGGDRTLTLTAFGVATGSPSVEVMVIQAENVRKDVLNPALTKIYSKTLVTEAVESAKKEALNRGAQYRLIGFKAFSDTGARVTSNAILNNVAVKVSGNSKRDWPFMALRAANQKAYGYNPTGYAFFDFCPNGQDKTMLDTRGMEGNGISLDTTMNISGAANNRVKIITMEVYQHGEW